MLDATKFLNRQQIEYVCKVCNLSPKDLEHVSEELDDKIDDKMLYMESLIDDEGEENEDVKMAISVLDTWGQSRWNDSFYV